MPSQDPEQARWFEAELRPHESMLRAWLHQQFSTDCDVDDIVQESFVRVLQARATTAIASPKSFLFATARNLALGRIRRQRVIGANPLAEIDLLAILDESADVPNAVARAQELELLTLAIQSLPARCRQVLTLRKIYGMSQRDVASQLGISEHTVEAQSTIGLRKIVAFFASRERRRQLP
jgi:RNA polymerase sigma-70 factor (ECF subfamily)